MFHTFQSQTGDDPLPPGVEPEPPVRKVNRSCSECTRRKVKCDGGHPCSSCRYYKVSEDCVYRQRSKRQATSKSALDKATETLRRQAGVLQLLFPNHRLDELVDKDRADLIQLISPKPTRDQVNEERTLQSPDPLPTTGSSGISGDIEDVPSSPEDLSIGESGEEERHWHESAQDPATIAASDDINALSLAGDRHRRSYLGITSVSAVLKSLFRLCPTAKDLAVEQSQTWPGAPQDETRPLVLNRTPGALAAPDSLREQRYIGFYFEHIHAITPLVDEESFRSTFATGDGQSPAWLGLCNMVLTLGSIASGSDTAHIHYYNRARSYLDLDSLGSGNLESLQALCLLGGYYLHYRNSPNMAYAILGAAQRLAIALGLHRESPIRADHKDSEAGQRYVARIETRRRTWWSLYCLDTWASMTLGRPTCGRWDTNTMNTLPPTLLGPDDHCAVSLRESSRMCHICNRLQDRFAQSTRIDTHEAQALDSELQSWYDSLPAILKDTTDAPPRITVAREFLRNRYYSVRMILSRCFLLYRAHEDMKRHTPNLAESQMVDLCRAVAAEAIDAIALHWVPNRIQVWNSAWYLFQACLVPLLSIAMETSSSSADYEPEPVMAWRTMLNKALEVFADMKPWMRASDRTPDIVAVLFQAVSQGTEGTIRTPSVTDAGAHVFGWADEQWTEMDWSLFLGDEDISHNLFSFT
ncbi:hypothetical protein NW759_014722 [Fusarium solani]|nr:hypothetical protein NW759_014722 [Fusarium solani]